MRRARRWVILGCGLLIVILAPVAGRVLALHKLERLLRGETVAIMSAQVLGRAGRLELSSPDVRLAVADLLRSATTDGAYDFSVAETTTLSLSFGFLQSISISMYITTDQQLVVSVPSGIWDELFSFSDQQLMRLQQSTGALGAHVVEVLGADPRKGS